jgi:uncharacterized cupin superfamily protein
MKLASLNVDSKGDSYWTEVESANPPGSNKEREQDVAYWQIWETQPGHFQDFKPSPDPRCLAVLAGKLEITASSGERRYFTRGDTFLLQDISGKGHTVRTMGWEVCSVLRVAMKQAMTATAAAGAAGGALPIEQR